MPPPPARSARWIVAGAVALMLASCGDGSETGATADPVSSTEAPSSSTDESQAMYVAFAGEGFRLQQGLNSGSDPAATGEPPLDWYAEYVSEPDYADMVRVSGHDVSLDDLKAERAMAIFDLKEAAAGEWTVLASGPAAEDPGGPVVLAFELADDYSVAVLSYDVDVDQLVEWAADLDRVSEDEWVASGGVVDE